MTTQVIPVGTSEPQDFELRNDGVALVGTGLTVTLEIYHRVNGVKVALAEDIPTVAWLNQAAGTVRVTSTEDLPVDNYYVRYKLDNGAGGIGYVPNGDKADLWRVVAIP